MTEHDSVLVAERDALRAENAKLRELSWAHAESTIEAMHDADNLRAELDAVREAIGGGDTICDFSVTLADRVRAVRKRRDELKAEGEAARKMIKQAVATLCEAYASDNLNLGDVYLVMERALDDLGVSRPVG